jgi:glutathione-independent formaldehyde dehydrogenase
MEDDFVLLADIFPTAWHANEQAHVHEGDTVAIYGAGPVGLLSAYSALLRGATEVFVVDRAPERLEKARQIGAIPVNFTKGDPAEQIKDLRKQNTRQQSALRPEGRKMDGVMCGIDAVGYQAHSDEHPDQEDPMQVIRQLAKLVNPTGHIGIIGVFFAEDPGGVNQNAQKGEYVFPLGEIWDKGIGIETGQAPVKRYNVALRDMIINGRARPSFIVSHRLPLSRAPEAYSRFVHRGVDEGRDYTKVVLKPALDRAA